MLGSVFVDYYGQQHAGGKTMQTISEKLHPIEKAIMVANIGFNPMNNGDLIIISVPH
jgi:ribosome recycling factor